MNPPPRLSAEEAGSLDNIGSLVKQADGEPVMIEARPSHWMVPLSHPWLLLLGLLAVLVGLIVVWVRGVNPWWLFTLGFFAVFVALALGLRDSLRDRYAVTPTRLLKLDENKRPVEQARIADIKDAWNDDAAAGGWLGLGTLVFSLDDKALGMNRVMRWKLLEEHQRILAVVQDAIRANNAESQRAGMAAQAPNAQTGAQPPAARPAGASRLGNVVQQASAEALGIPTPAPAHHTKIAAASHVQTPPVQPSPAPQTAPPAPKVVSPFQREPIVTPPPPIPARPARTMVVGLVGGIGSGKSTVAGILRTLGCIVIDADNLAKAALDMPSVTNQLTAWWGEGILNELGRVDRKKVAQIIFSDPAQRTRLEELVHPIVKADRSQVIARAKSEGQPGVVIDAPLLFESGSDKDCDAVIFVNTPAVRRTANVKARGWDMPELARREQAQMPLDEKKRRAHFVLDNDGDLATLDRRVREIWTRLTEGLSPRKPRG